MAFPLKSTSVYTAPSKNSSTSTLQTFAGHFQFLIDDTHFFLLDNLYRLSIAKNLPTWTYQSKT